MTKYTNNKKVDLGPRRISTFDKPLEKKLSIDRVFAVKQ